MIHLLLWLAVLVLPMVVWIAVVRRRVLPDPETIIRSFEKDSPQFSKRMNSEIPLSWSDFTDDRAFWMDLGGITGLWRIRRMAIKLNDLMNSYRIPEDEVCYIRNRVYGISICVILSLPGACMRFFFPKLPHYSARIAAHLYWESRIRAKTLIGENCPEKQLDALCSAL